MTRLLKYYILSLSLLTLSYGVSAQTLRLNAPGAVSAGETFNVIWTVDAKPDGSILLESSDKFRVVQGPSTSSSSSYQMINGKVSSSVEVLYTYYFQAPADPGTYSLPSAHVVVDGKQISCNPHSVEVTAASQSQNQQPQSQYPSQNQYQQQQPQTGSQNQVTSSAGDTYISLIPDKTTVYQGEPVNFALKLFTREQITQIGNAEFPDFDGFYHQDIDSPQPTSLTGEDVNGKTYGTAVIHRLAAIPQRSGQLKISPFRIVCYVMRQRAMPGGFGGFFDDFFSGFDSMFGSEEPVEIATKPVTINVKPLPSAGKPGNFDGAVGQFTITASLDKTQLKAHDAATLKIKVSGSGNLQFLNAPKTEFSPEIEAYDPKTDSSLSNGGTAGSKTFEYVLIPRYEGEYEVPAVELAYFDPKAETYKTVRTQPIAISVEGVSDSDTETTVHTSREDVKVLAGDIRFIRTGNLSLRAGDRPFFASLPFFVSYIVMAAVFTLILILRRKSILRNSDIVSLRNHRAGKTAAKRLKAARECMDSDKQEEFFEEVSKAMWGFIGDKLNINVADLSMDYVRQIMTSHNIPEDVTSSFMNIVETCDYARYAPSSSGVVMREIYAHAADIIEKIQYILK